MQRYVQFRHDKHAQELAALLNGHFVCMGLDDGLCAAQPFLSLRAFYIGVKPVHSFQEITTVLGELITAISVWIFGVLPGWMTQRTNSIWFAIAVLF